jgi:para-nitrobenzyl esterase
MKDYEKRVRAYFGAYADDVLKIFNPATDAEAKDMWAQIYGAIFFNYPHYCLNRLAAENGIPVYEYYFSKHNGRLGCWHSGEEIYFYGNIPAGSRLFQSDDRELSRVMSAYFVQFVKTGNPNGDSLPEWPANTGADGRLLRLDTAVAMDGDPFLPFYDYIEKAE